jgi:gamma-glutamylaminecyclotransferase
VANALDLFVYGSLLRGGKHHGLLREAALIGLGRTPPAYRLVDLGPYPGMLAEGATAVAGEVYRVPERTLSELDRLEEHPETYVRSTIRLSDGREVVTYLLRARLAAGRPEVASGDWRAYLRSRGGR